MRLEQLRICTCDPPGLRPYQAQKRSPRSVPALPGNNSRAGDYRAAFRAGQDFRCYSPYKNWNYYLFNKNKTDFDLGIQCWVNKTEGPQAIVVRLSRADGIWRRVDCGVPRTAKKVGMTTSLEFHQSAWTQDIHIPQIDVEKPHLSENASE